MVGNREGANERSQQCTCCHLSPRRTRIALMHGSMACRTTLHVQYRASSEGEGMGPKVGLAAWTARKIIWRTSGGRWRRRDMYDTLVIKERE